MRDSNWEGCQGNGSSPEEEGSSASKSIKRRALREPWVPYERSEVRFPASPPRKDNHLWLSFLVILAWDSNPGNTYKHTKVGVPIPSLVAVKKPLSSEILPRIIRVEEEQLILKQARQI